MTEPILLKRRASVAKKHSSEEIPVAISTGTREQLGITSFDHFSKQRILPCLNFRVIPRSTESQKRFCQSGFRIYQRIEIPGKLVGRSRGHPMSAAVAMKVVVVFFVVARQATFAAYVELAHWERLLRCRRDAENDNRISIRHHRCVLSAC